MLLDRIGRINRQGCCCYYKTKKKRKKNYSKKTKKEQELQCVGFSSDAVVDIVMGVVMAVVAAVSVDAAEAVGCCDVRLFLRQKALFRSE